MHLTAPPNAPATCAHFALFIKTKNIDANSVIRTAREGRAVTHDVDDGTEIFWVVFVDDGDNIVRGLSEEQLRDEILRRRGGILSQHW
ncbi:MAG: hypothetical protein CO029_02825 [Candidatus Magasanikbacteria bacterium CG_4_9_14_0_2_um_filter_41_10]|uniref:Uncharacterized protein n=1 Tax=Candidatus Magasanikbacteria bacterium CG_4_10_14_0_2_um_filter_41_31 TaxID=1974639 RepID=A0A2M7V345_9BACT|nr:MAG: hypothetical protein AUJ37_00020 [Candidatus Magasanikbacteria bacterium CG1_02_41_34]PIZ92885.1 MAG: hypothetical protein COX83_03270 [Candidatus Magasanikbacteria bacterium CG_4_10_14_0_2_um_filter_41_31]PJC53426.1 MAG: hypothetical protein CO029_02825 [Candidatus Magasanikbacteria bacterium CG_4_9_14_0_2_um_filter_41_10]